uniref:Ig-like domain-containing protein n=1 Tax=Romanomermis culicivorax TaxID=13658 RepID=A0A915HHW8_ROMCU
MLIPTLLFFICYRFCSAQDDSIPSIISQQDLIHSVVEGSNVVLPCKFDKSIGVYSIVWRKSSPEDDDNVLFAERSRITDDERLSYTANDDPADWSIKIQKVRSSDAGTYECTLSSDPTKTLTQKLEIKSPPIVNILPEKSPQILPPGSPLTLTCQAIGNPTPTITWSKSIHKLGKDGALPPTDISRPGQLVFKSVSDVHSGIYECTADNTVGQPAHAKQPAALPSQKSEFPDERIPNWATPNER